MPKERQSAEASKIVKRLPATECRRYALSSNFPLPQISHPFLLAFRLILRIALRAHSGFFLYILPRASTTLKFKNQTTNTALRRNPSSQHLNISSNRNRASTIRFFATPHLHLVSVLYTTAGVTTVLLADPTPRVATNRPATKRKESSVIYAAKSKNLCLMIA